MYLSSVPGWGGLCSHPAAGSAGQMLAGWTTSVQDGSRLLLPSALAPASLLAQRPGLAEPGVYDSFPASHNQFSPPCLGEFGAVQLVPGKVCVPDAVVFVSAVW